MLTRVFLVSHRSICRTPMEKFVMKAEKARVKQEIFIESAACTAGAFRSLVYPPVRRKLAEHSIDCAGKTARLLTSGDCTQYGRMIGMGGGSLRDIRHLCGGPKGKLHLLLEYADRPDFKTAGPWYIHDFEATWRDVEESRDDRS